MRRLAKPLLLVAVVLAVPIVPFLFLGERLEGAVEAALRQSLSPAATAGLVIAVLSSDVLLPVPSSVVSTFAGSMLGVPGGTLASWTGMMLGCAAAFAVSRAAGRPLAERFATRAELERVDGLADRYGPWALAIARGVPVLAEASVLLFGAARLSWRRFLPCVALSNLGISAAYAVLGDRAGLGVALAASIALPLAAAIVARVVWPTRICEA